MTLNGIKHILGPYLFVCDKLRILPPSFLKVDHSLLADECVHTYLRDRVGLMCAINDLQFTDIDPRGLILTITP